MSSGILLAALATAAPGISSPVIVPDAPVMRLDEIGLYRVVYRYRGQPERDMPFGWTGHFDAPTGISCQPQREQSGRKAFLIHCPWRNGTGVTAQIFTIALPRVRRITLTGFTAMLSDIVDRSDGTTYRVYVNSNKVLEHHQRDDVWRPFRVDLSAYRGTTVHIRFETDPGPTSDPSFDYSLWADRTLVMQGYAPPQPPRYPRLPLDLARLSRFKAKGVAPQSGWAGRTRVDVRGSLAMFRYSGPDGVFEYSWETASPGLGRILLRVSRKGTKPLVVPLGTGHRVEWTAPATQTRSILKFAGSRAVCTKTVKVGEEPVSLTITASLSGKTLVLALQCDKPVISSFNAGDWGPVLRRKYVPVPYYGSITYFPREGLFVNRFLDWTASRASRHGDGAAFYEPLTDGSRNPLSECALFSVGTHLAEVLPSIPNPPSPYLREVGGKIVLDVWGGQYTDIARKLENLHSYGIRHCIVLIHDWQRSGYDNALPMHIPAASDKGGDEGMRLLCSTATRLGYRIALHENYVDYYPNYDYFDENHIALSSDGQRVLAWYNAATRIQSFAVKPNAILPLARTQSPEIHRRFGTNACYLDVHSAVPPWFHVDFRAGEEGAGLFRQVFEAHRKLWEYERTTHGGPVFGEGNAHWFWSGLLDGVEAQFGTGWPTMAGQKAPLMVDFNLLRVHPLQINHGQGYYERWWSDYPWGAVPPVALLDQYRLQEVLYGHIGFLGSSTWDKVPYAWLEHHLMTPVTSRHAGVPVKSIDYFVGGRWVDGSEAAIAGEWKRPRVVFANGLTIIGNGSGEPWRAHGATLPPNGWIAHGAGVTAYTAIRDGVVVDYAGTASTVFANARPASDWALASFAAVRPQVTLFQQNGVRSFEVRYAWHVTSPPRHDYDCFVHFSKRGRDPWDEDIAFQQDHPLPTPCSRWQPGSVVADGPYTVTIPDGVPDGEYEWSIGLWTRELGRALLDGPTDASGRILLGTLVISGGGSAIQFRPTTKPYTSRAAMLLAAVNSAEKVVTFSSVRTNGSVYVVRESSEWVLRPFPRDRGFTLYLNSDRFGTPGEVRSIGGKTPTAQTFQEGRWWRLAMNGATEYRWTAAAP